MDDYEAYRPSEVRKKKAALRKKNLLRAATHADSKPMTLDKIKALQVDGQLSIEAFKDNIGKLFPVVLLLISSGYSVGKVESYLGMNALSLQRFITINPVLKAKCNEARKINRDRESLDLIELRYILS